MKGKWLAVMLGAALLAHPALGQTCTSGGEMDAATRASLGQVAQQFFAMASRGDVFSMRQQSIPLVNSNFGAIEATVVQQKALYAGVQAQVRATYLLEADGTQPIPSARFYCGVYGSSSFASFVIPNLPPGKYAVVILDIETTAGPYELTTVLQQDGGAWKLAGYYSRPTTWDGHDGNWYLQQARQYAAQGQAHSAYLYYLAALELLPPVKFMSWPDLDKIYDEARKAAPSDFPVNGPVTMELSGKSYTISQIFPLEEATGLVLVIRYQSGDISDTAAALNDNLNVIKGMVARYPELRQSFAGVVARATEPSGRDYGTLLAMKDVK
jgi:hypothetical protein